MGRIATSFHLVKQSWEVLKKDKEIMLFPIVSGVVAALLFLSFIIPLFVSSAFSNSAYMLLFFIYYLLSYFIVIFFNTAVVACANKRLNGGDPTFKDGMNAAFSHIGRIFVWSLVSATVGIILRAISDKSETLGKIVTAIIGAVWSLITFFVIPVMIFENIGVFKAIARSGQLLKKTWGENLIGQASMGIFFFLLALIGVVPFLLALWSGSIIVILIAVCLVVLYWITLAVISSALSGIFMAALYNYAKNGKMPKGFDERIIKDAFARR